MSATVAPSGPAGDEDEGPPEIELAFLEELAAPPRVPVTSIYSSSDGIVHWRSCRRPDVRSLEVDGSHVGLPVNPDVYALLASLLPGRQPRR